MSIEQNMLVTQAMKECCDLKGAL